MKDEKLYSTVWSIVDEFNDFSERMNDLFRDLPDLMEEKSEKTEKISEEDAMNNVEKHGEEYVIEKIYKDSLALASAAGVLHAYLTNGVESSKAPNETIDDLRKKMAMVSLDIYDLIYHGALFPEDEMLKCANKIVKEWHEENNKEKKIWANLNINDKKAATTELTKTEYDFFKDWLNEELECGNVISLGELAGMLELDAVTHRDIYSTKLIDGIVLTITNSSIDVNVTILDKYPFVTIFIDNKFFDSKRMSEKKTR